MSHLGGHTGCGGVLLRELDENAADLLQHTFGRTRKIRLGREVQHPCSCPAHTFDGEGTTVDLSSCSGMRHTDDYEGKKQWLFSTEDFT